MSRQDLDIDIDDVDKIIDEADISDTEDDQLDIDEIIKESDENSYLTSIKRRRTLSKGRRTSRGRADSIGEKYEHPLATIENYERDISLKLGGQPNLDSKFLLSNYQAIYSSTHTNVSFETMETISKQCFLTSLTVKHKKEAWGSPKCIAVFPPRYIAIGTSRGLVLLFDFAQAGPQVITNYNQEYGGVTAIDISMKDDTIVCGYESGHIIIWGISKNEHIKTIPPTENSPILAIKFWKETRTQFIASDAKGFVYLFKLDSVFFQWAVDRKILLNPDKKLQEEKEINKELPNGILSIQVLRKDLCEGHILNKYSVVALGSLKMVLVITLEPALSKVFKYERPPGISSFSAPSMSWGRGAVAGCEEDKHPLLAIAWGSEIDVFQFQNVEGDHQKTIKYLASFHSNAELYHIEWISDNNILTYDSNKELKLVNTGHFRPRLGPNQVGQDFDYSKAETLLAITDPDIAFNIYHCILEDFLETSHQERPIMFFSNTVSAFPSLRKVFVLGFNTFSVIKHFDWKEYIEALKNKADWLAALSFYVNLYKGKAKSFAGLPLDIAKLKEIIRPYSAELVRDYLISIKKTNGLTAPDQIKEIWRMAMLTVMDFLISVDNFEFLFTEIRKVFSSLSMHEEFFEALEAFILRDRVKLIPNEPFRELVEYYALKQRTDLLQYLIINLSLKDIDIDYAITLCMEYNLLTPLMYLCIHREGAEGADFLTPIARALSTYQKSVEEENPNKQEYGLKFLWFLEITLQGKKFPSGEIPDDAWQEKMKDLLILVFNEVNLGLMLQIDAQICFEILYSFFNTKLGDLIDTYEGTIQIVNYVEEDDAKTKQKSISIHFKKILESFIETMGNKLKTQMVALIYYCAKKDKNHHNLLYYMLSNLAAHLNMNIPDKIMEECLLYILKSPKDVAVWESRKLVKTKRNEDEEDNQLEEERTITILKLLKKLENKLTPDKLQEIVKLTEYTEFVDVKVYLSQIKHEYKKCFDLYLNQSAREKRMKIFEWLENTIPMLKDSYSEYFKDVKDSLLYRLRELVSLNSEKTRKIILGLDRNLEVEAIKQLEPIPKLQLDYLKGMFTYREGDGSIPDDLLILHLRLLCELEPKQVIKEVKSHTYPLDEAMKLCKKYDVKNALAFLLERAGNMAEALRVNLGLFRMSLEKKLRKIEKEGVFSIVENESGSLLRKLNDAKEICFKYNKVGDLDSEAMWFRVLDSLLSCYQDYIANNKAIQDSVSKEDDVPQNRAYRKLSRAYSDYISTLFEDMTKCVAVESILAKLNDYSRLKLGDLKTSILGVLKTYYYESNILEDARALVIGDMFDSLKGFHTAITQGAWSTKSSINADFIDSVVLFSCGHMFPRNYVQGNLCIICSDHEALRVHSMVSQSRRGAYVARNRGAVPIEFINPQSSLQQDRERLNNATRSGALFKDSGFRRQRQLGKLESYEQVYQDEHNDWDEEGFDTNMFYIK